MAKRKPVKKEKKKEKIIKILEPLCPRYIDLPPSYTRKGGKSKKRNPQEAYIEDLAEKILKLFH